MEEGCTSNLFDILPSELLVEIFLVVPSILDVVRLCLVCKRFDKLLHQRQDIWRAHCLKFWEESGLKGKDYDLEWALKESEPFGKNWQFFSRCFAKQTSKDCLTYYESNNRVYI